MAAAGSSTATLDAYPLPWQHSSAILPAALACASKVRVLRAATPPRGVGSQSNQGSTQFAFVFCSGIWAGASSSSKGIPNTSIKAAQSLSAHKI